MGIARVHPSKYAEEYVVIARLHSSNYAELAHKGYVVLYFSDSERIVTKECNLFLYIFIPELGLPQM